MLLPSSVGIIVSNFLYEYLQFVVNVNDCTADEFTGRKSRHNDVMVLPAVVVRTALLDHGVFLKLGQDQRLALFLALGVVVDLLQCKAMKNFLNCFKN